MQKRWLALLLMLCLVLPCAALAELDEDGDVVVALEGAEFFFTPPEDAYMLSLESSASEFTALGLSQRELIPWMNEYDIVVLFFDRDFGWEMHIQAYPWQYGDFDDMDAIGLEREALALAYHYRDGGCDVISCEPYRAPEGHQFLCAEMQYSYEDGVVEPQVEYYTIQGETAVSVYLIGYTSEITDEQRAIAQAVADSLWIKPVQ